VFYTSCEFLKIPSGYQFDLPKKKKKILNNPLYQQHVLATGFPVLQGGQNQASPGAAHAFHPIVANKGKEKPTIVVAGDGSQKAYLVTPNSQDPQDWSYTTTVLHNCTQTVGGIATGDVDGDGITEIFIPCYDNGQLVAYTFA
jgi:hypothetical protein